MNLKGRAMSEYKAMCLNCVKGLSDVFISLVGELCVAVYVVSFNRAIEVIDSVVHKTVCHRLLFV